MFIIVVFFFKDLTAIKPTLAVRWEQGTSVFVPWGLISCSHAINCTRTDAHMYTVIHANMSDHVFVCSECHCRFLCVCTHLHNHTKTLTIVFASYVPISSPFDTGSVCVLLAHGVRCSYCSFSLYLHVSMRLNLSSFTSTFVVSTPCSCDKRSVRMLFVLSTTSYVLFRFFVISRNFKLSLL